MLGILLVLFAIMFDLVFVSILIGSFQSMSLSGKVFQLVERQLYEQLSRTQSGSPASEDATKLQFVHCGSAVVTAEKCPSCGATQ